MSYHLFFLTVEREDILLTHSINKILDLPVTILLEL